MKASYFSHIRNPMTIIALFVGLSEIALGIVFLNAPTNYQLPLLVILIGFPAICAIGFFLVLFFRPHHFYGPQDFRKDESYISLQKQDAFLGELTKMIAEKQASESEPITDESIAAIVDKLSKRACFYLLKVAGKPMHALQHVEVIHNEIEFSSISQELDKALQGAPIWPSQQPFTATLMAIGYLISLLSNLDGVLFDATLTQEKGLLLNIPSKILELLGEKIAHQEQP